MAGSTKNFHLVPMEDRPYFLRATVVGLRAQLQELGLPSSGLKVELYFRLTEDGHRLYTDDRDGSDDDDSDHQSDDDQSDDDQSENDQSDGQSDDDQLDDDQPGDNNGDDGQGNDDQGGSPPGGSGRKRRRNGEGGGDNGDNNGDDNQGSPPPPPRKIIRVGALPVEMQLQMMGNLTAAQLWNLITASPAGYLLGDINAFVIEARSQHRIDHPPVDNNDGGGGGGGNDDVDEPNRPLSMLELVGRRLIYDPSFRTTWRGRILQVINTYLQVYGQADNAPEDRNAVEDILFYFRPQPLYGTPFPLLRAAREHRADVVHLLLLRGEPVDQTMPGSNSTALSSAVERGLDRVFADNNGMYTIFALIGAGADVTLTSLPARVDAREILEEFMTLPESGQENGHRWERIFNLRGSSVREFIGDPRSDFLDRIKLAMYVVAYSIPGVDLDYPGFE